MIIAAAHVKSPLLLLLPLPLPLVVVVVMVMVPLPLVMVIVMVMVLPLFALGDCSLVLMPMLVQGSRALQPPEHAAILVCNNPTTDGHHLCTASNACQCMFHPSSRHVTSSERLI